MLKILTFISSIGKFNSIKGQYCAVFCRRKYKKKLAKEKADAKLFRYLYRRFKYKIFKD